MHFQFKMFVYCCAEKITCKHFQLELPSESLVKCVTELLYSQLQHAWWNCIIVLLALEVCYPFLCSTSVWGLHCSFLGYAVIAALHVSRNAVIWSHYAFLYGMETCRFNGLNIVLGCNITVHASWCSCCVANKWWAGWGMNVLSCPTEHSLQLPSLHSLCIFPFFSSNPFCAFIMSSQLWFTGSTS
jgi:hypothetical protein